MRGLLALQRSAGNRAVARVLQRQGESPPAGSAPNAPGPGQDAATGPQTIGNGMPLTIDAAMTTIDSPFTQAKGTLRVDTLIADSVVAASYSPGAGNVY